MRSTTTCAISSRDSLRASSAMRCAGRRGTEGGTMAKSSKRDALYLGRDRRDGESVFLSAHHLPEHVHVLGAPGVGKSVSCIYPLYTQLCERGDGAVIVFSPKGALI